MTHDSEGKFRPLASADSGGEAASPLGGDSAGCGSEHGLRGGTGAAGEDPRTTRPDRATRFVETTRGILSYQELAPLLAERVTLAEAAIYSGEFSECFLDENLILAIHHRICMDLVPDWAGRWRSVEVRVGNLHPAQSFLLPMLMRDYTLDLRARLDGATGGDETALLECLAFAEGRFLTIHPFQDFNGRTIRLLLTELLRRLDLPMVSLAPEGEEGRKRYFTALEAADTHDWRPLMEIWEERFVRE